MIYHASSYRVILSGLILMLLSVAPALSSVYIGSYCVDIESSASSSRILKLAVTAVGDDYEYYSLAGSPLNTAQSSIGSAGGTASVASNNELILTVNASSAEDTSMTSTQYQFNLNLSTLPSTLFGKFQSFTQKSISGTITQTDYKSGKAALVSCNVGLTDFSSPGNPTEEDPTPDVPTPEDPYYNVYDYDKDFDPSPAFGGSDCNNNNPKISSREKEVCGDGIDNNCNGVIDEDCGSSGGNTGVDSDDDGYTVAQGDCNDTIAAINPGATEICDDNIDQDCDGNPKCDELVPTGCVDFDRDGFNKAGVGINCGPVDCDDTTPYINPGMPEMCGNQLDENCQASDNICTTYPEYKDVTTDTMSQVGTNLVWQKGHYDTYYKPAVVWSKAVQICNDLDLGGAKDWRLPTVQELRGIVDLLQKGPAKIDPRFASSPTGYWTATANVNNSDFAYGVDFSDGKVKSILKTMLTFDALVRCVRLDSK